MKLYALSFYDEDVYTHWPDLTEVFYTKREARLRRIELMKKAKSGEFSFKPGWAHWKTTVYARESYPFGYKADVLTFQGWSVMGIEIEEFEVNTPNKNK